MKRILPIYAILPALLALLTEAEAITINLGSDRDDSYLYKRRDRRDDNRRDEDHRREARHRDDERHRRSNSTAGDIAEMIKKGDKPQPPPPHRQRR